MRSTASHSNISTAAGGNSRLNRPVLARSCAASVIAESKSQRSCTTSPKCNATAKDKSAPMSNTAASGTHNRVSRRRRRLASCSFIRGLQLQAIAHAAEDSDADVCTRAGELATQPAHEHFHRRQAGLVVPIVERLEEMLLADDASRFAQEELHHRALARGELEFDATHGQALGRR